MFATIYSSDWCGEGLFRAPSVYADSRKDDGVSDSKLKTPRLQALSFAVKRNLNCAFAVLVLLGFGCPSAVSESVSLGGDNSVASVVSGRSRPHIAKEVTEIHPFVAYRNSASAVSCVGGVVGVFASIKHPFPNHVFWAHGATGRMPMFEVHFGANLTSNTSTGFDISANQVVLPRDLGVAAVALTQPSALFLGRLLCPFNNGEPSEFLTS